MNFFNLYAVRRPRRVVKNRNGRVIRMLETTFVRQMRQGVHLPTRSSTWIAVEWTSTGTW